MRWLVGCIFGVVLLGCASQQFNSGVAAAEVGLTASMQLALAYTQLPRCGSAGVGVICSDQAVVDRIKSSATVAYNAVKEAEANEALVGAALTAISAFKATIPAGGGK